jgi:malate dehydrogenase (oxaloacetate-decarboxylating)
MTDSSTIPVVSLDASGDRVLDCPYVGEQLLTMPLLNKGTAFDQRERAELGLLGLLPPKVSTMAEQTHRVMENYRRRDEPLDQYMDLIG